MMPLDDSQIEFLENLDKGQHMHGKKVLAKRDSPIIGKFYQPYRDFSSALAGNIDRAVAALNEYKNFVRRENTGFTAQSQFESSILEEFLCQILKARFGNDVLMYGSVKAYSSMYFSHGSKEEFKRAIDLKLNVKDQDVGIYKQEVIRTADGKKHKIFVPIVCIECKTYLDKTMYEGSVATAMKIKSGNPHCLFFIVTETYAVAADVEISLTPIDNIYILRKQRSERSGTNPRNPIFPEVVQHLLDHVAVRLNTERLPVDTMLEQRGYLRVQPELPEWVRAGRRQ